MDAGLADICARAREGMPLDTSAQGTERSLGYASSLPERYHHDFATTQRTFATANSRPEPAAHPNI